MSALIKGLNHVNLLSSNPQATSEFYQRLGLIPGFRPPGFADPGIWLYADGGKGYQILHINEAQKERFRYGLDHVKDGDIAHVGFNVAGRIDAVVTRLKNIGINPELWDPIPGAHRALYFDGPSKEKIEFVFVDEPIVPLGV